MCSSRQRPMMVILAVSRGLANGAKNSPTPFRRLRGRRGFHSCLTTHGTHSILQEPPLYRIRSTTWTAPSSRRTEPRCGTLSISTFHPASRTMRIALKPARALSTPARAPRASPPCTALIGAATARPSRRKWAKLEPLPPRGSETPLRHRVMSFDVSIV